MLLSRGTRVVAQRPSFHFVSMTAPLSGDNSVFGICLISGDFSDLNKRSQCRERGPNQLYQMLALVRAQPDRFVLQIVCRANKAHSLALRAHQNGMRDRLVPCERTPRKSALSLMPVAQKTMFLPLARSSAMKMRSRSFSFPSAISCLRSFSSRGHILHCMSPPRHLIPAAASTASGEPPMPM